MTIDPDSPPRLATCSYRQYQPWMGVPVQASLGKPHHPVPGLLALRAAMPPPKSLGLAYEPFRRAYRHKLHKLTLGGFLGAVDRVRAAAGGDHNTPLVLLCFEHLALPGQWCHRTLLAEWLADQDVECFEYGDFLLPAAIPA
jgi:hypothetical protein